MDWVFYWRSSSARDLFQRRGRPRKCFFFYVSANSIGVFSIRCSFKFFIYLFYFIFILSSQTFINRSVQNTFKFAFYTNRSRLILLRQISNDNFLKAPLKSNNFQKRAARTYSGRFRIKNVTDRVYVVTQKI